MVIEFLQVQVLGNTLLQYILFILILVIAFFIGRFIYFLFSKVLYSLTKKTKTQLDDLLVAALKAPILWLVIVIALHFAIDVFTLPAVVNKIYLEVYFSAWIFIIGWFIIRIIDSVLATYLMPLAKKSKSRLDDTLFPFVKRFVNFVLYFIVITIILQQIGIQVTGLLAGLGIGGLAFALAAKDLLANLFGGVVVVTDKPFKIGDRIRVSGNDGKVKKISMRSTTLETFDGTNIVIPNSTIADSILENVSRERMRRVLLVLGVEYGTSTKKLEKAKKILAGIILKNDKTDDDSLVHFKAFGSSSLDIQLIYWIRDLNQILATQDEVNFAIKRAFEKEGIEFAFPSQTVYFRKD